MEAIFNFAILNLAILDSVILVFLSNSFTLGKIGSHFCTKNFTYLFWLNWMMVAILNSVMLIQTLPSWIWPPCYLLSDSLKKLSLHYDSDSN